MHACSSRAPQFLAGGVGLLLLVLVFILLVLLCLGHLLLVLPWSVAPHARHLCGLLHGWRLQPLYELNIPIIVLYILSRFIARG